MIKNNQPTSKDLEIWKNVFEKASKDPDFIIVLDNNKEIKIESVQISNETNDSDYKIFPAIVEIDASKQFDGIQNQEFLEKVQKIDISNENKNINSYSNMIAKEFQIADITSDNSFFKNQMIKIAAICMDAFKNLKD